MLSYEEALKKLLSQTPEPRPEAVPLARALGLVLAEAVHADMDLPPFRKSFMDGYALRTADLEGGVGRHAVAGVVAAGQPPGQHCEAGQAWQIMTGAAVPDGADAVQMVEKTRRPGDWVEILDPVAAGENVAPQGSEVRTGRQVLEAGRRLGAAEIGVLATFGVTEVAAYRRLRAAIVSTGDELVGIERAPRPGQIRNSNAHMLAAQCRLAGLQAEILPTVGDDPGPIRETIRAGLEGRDLLILSGGVSMGEFDYVHRVLGEQGIEIFFHKAAIKPGKPLIVGRRGEQMVFGLPGNPVSSFVTFEVFARPALRKWMGLQRLSLPRRRARLAETIRHKTGRLFFMPALTRETPEGLEAAPIETRGSADLVAFAPCNALLLFPAEVEEISAGAEVEVMLLECR